MFGAAGTKQSNYETVDHLQKILAEQVFSYASDSKKAAGRALGTLVEVVTYYTLCLWGLSDHIVIESKIAEFGNPEISHNVEFSLHSICSSHKVKISPISLPVTPVKIREYLPELAEKELKTSQVVSSNSVKRNAAVLTKSGSGLVVANVELLNKNQCSLTVCDLFINPLAIVECKRVGVEEGAKKGPQTIEKAKQGAYVARSVSSLQKVRLRDGSFEGIIELNNGEFKKEPYFDLQRKVLKTPEDYPGFVFTLGIVSNHGNWFTAKNQNKELRVLSQSYDWLLFLTDQGLSKFIKNFILNPSKGMSPVRNAFFSSYTGQSGKNRFTKVNIDVDADRVLRKYFDQNRNKIESWFNVISPSDRTISNLRNDLQSLVRSKNLPKESV